MAEDQQVIREEILKRNLSAFVANGSILPRESGNFFPPDEEWGSIPFAERDGSGDRVAAQRKDYRYGDSMWNYFDRRRRLSREIHIV